MLLEFLIELFSKRGELPSLEFAHRHTAPGLARSNDGGKHQLHHRALAEGVRNDLRSPALLAEESLEQIGRARDSAMSDRHPQMRDAGVEVVLEARHGRRKFTLPGLHELRGRQPRQLRCRAGADVVVVDGMQGGTAATQEVFIEHVGIPTLAAIGPAVKALKEMGVHRKVKLIISGGIRTGADVAKALALGADSVAIGTAALIALGDNDPRWSEEYIKLGSAAGYYDDFHEGRDPAGITTQDPELAARLDPVEAGKRLKNYLQVLTLEAQTIARACGKSHVTHLEPEDMVALTIESAAMTGLPLAGTDWVPGRNGGL